MPAASSIPSTRPRRPTSATGASRSSCSTGRSSQTRTIKSMDDASTPAGAQPRLSNLGYGAFDALAGVLDQITRLALARFQLRHELPASGDLDPTTAARLKERHGS